MPMPRKSLIARRGLDIDRLHQLATGIPRPQCSACGWKLPWKWRDDEREQILAEMREAWNENRDQVIAYAAALSGGKRLPWARCFDSQEVA